MQLAKPLLTVGSILIAGYNAITEQSSEGYLIICDKRLTGRRAQLEQGHNHHNGLQKSQVTNYLTKRLDLCNVYMFNSLSEPKIN